ncbi:interferon-induced very large GTPase 1-like [Pecten maximus]|uniref:interferon-induced very large GTPase 1-like n=1 Tax=Pecten maximus TaxID=6579 RepID=UPI0014581ED3|nr:interferon-induced very large GTPase 1-like [Pecten maximus]
MKELRKVSHLSLKAKSKIEDEMRKLRVEQWKAYNSLLKSNAASKSFMESLGRFYDGELYFFLETLKDHLNEKFRKETPIYRRDYEKAWLHFQASDTDKTEVERAEKHMSDASVGIEHFFREVGQIYEASKSIQNAKLKMKPAEAVARSIMLGFPFELMDGDVANVPVVWIKQVFSELKSSLTDKKILTLSILGLQSSGKSTLLNAMFGISFSVSAGRCTRGMYMHLLPVKTGNFDFDFVLVVDTEGLRAPELSSQKYQHDNELATMVLGMADITIVNIKGENTSEVNDILQICVHALLRLKMANKKLRLRQSCIFIHQNVSAVDAEDALFYARKKLHEELDRITLEASQLENNDVKQFKDIIDFESNEHVWYFSDLWKGDPPMATVNPGYHNKIKTVKAAIFERLAKRKTSYLNIADTITHFEDLWNGILANDFVFSFRNSLEIRNYNALEDRFTAFVWELEKFKNNLVREFKHDIKQCQSYRELSTGTKGFREKCEIRFGDKISEIKKKLIAYFEDSDNKSDIAHWKDQKLQSWETYAKDFNIKLQIEMKYLQDHMLVDLQMSEAFDRNKREIADKASILAEKIKGNTPTKEEMESTFESLWSKWIAKWDVEEDKEDEDDIQATLKHILNDRFHRNSHLIGPELDAHPWHDRNMQYRCLEKSLDNVDFKPYITVRWELFKKAKSEQQKVNVYQICYQIVLQIINSIFREVDTKLTDLSKTDWKFNKTDVKEISNCILEHIEQHNRDGNNEFYITEACKVKLNVVVFGQSLPLFKKLTKQYQDKYSMKEKLNKHRDIVWGHFSDIVQQKTSDIVARNRFCEIIRENVEEYVRQQLSDLVFTYIVDEFSAAKHELNIRILTDLAEQDDFGQCVQYVNDVYNYSFRWMERFINKRCFAEPPHGKYYYFAEIETRKIITKILEFVRIEGQLDLKEWIGQFQIKIRNDLPIQPEAFYLVHGQTVSDMDDFQNKILEDLCDVRQRIVETFFQDTADSITWQNPTPYNKVMEKLWGCKSVCPFCKEPCKWNSIHEGSPHSCIQHRATGLSGWRFIVSEILIIESCSFNVQSNNSFKCGSSGLCNRDSNKCSKTGKTEKYHPYRNYEQFVPDWDIHPCPSVSSSVYWAWMLCKYNEKLAEYYGIVKAEIPVGWNSYSKEDAIKSLREY